MLLSPSSGSHEEQVHYCVLVCCSLPFLSFMLDHYVMFWSLVLFCGPGWDGDHTKWPEGEGSCTTTGTKRWQVVDTNPSPATSQAWWSTSTARTLHREHALGTHTPGIILKLLSTGIFLSKAFSSPGQLLSDLSPSLLWSGLVLLAPFLRSSQHSKRAVMLYRARGLWDRGVTPHWLC